LNSLHSNVKVKLKIVENLTKGSKFKRFLHNPFKYLFAQFIRRVYFNATKKSIKISTNIITNHKYNLLLPAGMDIYLFGAKTHPSEIRLTRYILNNLKKGDVIIDIGAHFGFYSLLASSLIGENGRVFSIEGSKANYTVLAKNISSNKNILGFNMACSNKDEAVSYFEYPVLYSEYNSMLTQQHEQSEWIKKYPPKQIEIEGKTLDTFVNENKVKPNFIKIDVEGAELMVIEGMSALLDSSKHLRISLEYVLEENSNYEKAVEKLMTHNFSPHIIIEDGSLKAIKPNDINNHLNSQLLISDNLIFKKD